MQFTKSKLFLTLLGCSLCTFAAGFCGALWLKDTEAGVMSSLNLATHVRMRDAAIQSENSGLVRQLDVAMFQDLVLMSLLDNRPSSWRPESEQRQRERSVLQASESWKNHPSAVLDSESKAVIQSIFDDEMRPR